MCAQNLPGSDPHRASERSLGTARIVVCPSLSSFFAALALFRLLPYGLSLTRRSIGQTLADDAFQRASGTLHIIYAKSDALAIPEMEFRKVAVQMLLAAMLINALHAALEDRIVALDGVGGDDVTLAR